MSNAGCLLQETHFIDNAMAASMHSFVFSGVERSVQLQKRKVALSLADACERAEYSSSTSFVSFRLCFIQYLLFEALTQFWVTQWLFQILVLSVDLVSHNSRQTLLNDPVRF